MVDKLNIGGYHYSVVEEPDPQSTDDDGKTTHYMGLASSEFNRITIKSTMDSEVKISTTWHEIIHMLLRQSGFQDDDETIADALGYALPQFLIHNSEFVNETYEVLNHVEKPKLMGSVVDYSRTDWHSLRDVLRANPGNETKPDTDSGC